MRLSPIESDALDGVGYDAVDSVLTVKFSGGGTYEYFDVPSWLYDEMLAAQPHPWSECGEQVKPYRYRRVG